MSKSKTIGSDGLRVAGIALAVILAMTLCFALMTISAEKSYATDVTEIDKVELTFEVPKCGTEIKVEGEGNDDPNYTDTDVTQTPLPSVTVNTPGVYLAIDDENVQQYFDEGEQKMYLPCYVNKSNPPLLDYKKNDLFAGIMTTGSEVWLKVPLYWDFDNYMPQYDHDSELTDDGYTTNMTATVNGKEEIIRVPSGPMVVLLKIEPKDLAHN